MKDLRQTGVPVNEVIESCLKAYLKGFDDALEVLKASRESIDIDAMKKSMVDTFKEKISKSNNEW